MLNKRQAAICAKLLALIPETFSALISMISRVIQFAVLRNVPIRTMKTKTSARKH
jgi:hypothetical protein